MDAPFARFMDLLATTSTLAGLASTVNAEAFWLPVNDP